MAHCNVCGTSAAVCQECATGFTIQNSGADCLACTDVHCLTCTSAAVCTGCEDGWIVVSDVCQACSTTMTHCTACSDANTCDTCATGYYNAGGSPNVCTSCSTAMTDCLECSADNVCTKCATGKAPNVAGDACITCNSADGILNCIDCSN